MKPSMGPTSYRIGVSYVTSTRHPGNRNGRDTFVQLKPIRRDLMIYEVQSTTVVSLVYPMNKSKTSPGKPKPRRGPTHEHRFEHTIELPDDIPDYEINRRGEWHKGVEPIDWSRLLSQGKTTYDLDRGPYHGHGVHPLQFPQPRQICPRPKSVEVNGKQGGQCEALLKYCQCSPSVCMYLFLRVPFYVVKNVFDCWQFFVPEYGERASKGKEYILEDRCHEMNRPTLG